MWEVTKTHSYEIWVNFRFVVRSEFRGYEGSKLIFTELEVEETDITALRRTS